MSNKEPKEMISSNGIRIKGDIVAFVDYEKGKEAETAIKELENLQKKRQKPLNEVSKVAKKGKKQKKKKTQPQQKANIIVETEAEMKRKAAVQKRIVKFHQEMSNTKSASHSSFKVMQKVKWILDWNCVMFKNGYMVIYAHSNSGVKFSPQKSYVSGVLESYNYLKKYLNDRLPPIRCEIEGMQLRIIDKINFKEALHQFARAARQGVIKIGRNSPTAIGSPLPMSFSQALSKAKQMTPEEFQKYKSKYIDYLVTQQSKNYKVIPCVERLAHTNSDNSEYAFMFSIECSSGKILIVHENVNPDRSTLLFLVKAQDFNRSIREIYDFLQGAEINKRSSLRDRSVEIQNAGIISYRSINHDDPYSWKQTISSYKRYR